MDVTMRLLLAAAIVTAAPPCDSSGVVVRHLVSLEYPPIAAQARLQGPVELECKLRYDGSVIEIKTVSGHPVLAAAARANVEKWRFQVPDQLPSKELSFNVTYDFRLEGACFSPNCTSTFSFDYPSLVTVVTQAHHWQPSKRRE